MFSDVSSEPELFQRVTYSRKEQEDTAEWEERKLHIYMFMEENPTDSPSDGGEQQTTNESEKKTSRRAALCKGVLCVVMLAGIISLNTFIALETIKLNSSYSQRPEELLENNSQLQKHLNQSIEVKQMKNKTEENSQMRNNSETQCTGYSLLKEEIKKLKETIKEKWCPDGWKRFGCSCYFKFTEKKTWTESRKICQDRGADLVIINSREEQEFVADLNQNGESWIGLKGTQNGWRYEWRWVDESPLTETFWETGRPPYFYDPYATCCSDQRKWTNPPDDSQLNWICEK